MSSVTTPKHIAAYASMIVSIIPGIIVVYLSGSILWTGLSVILTFTTGLLVVNYFLDRFIYKKIKVIYKNIHRLKTQHLKEPGEMVDPIAEVSSEVMAWAKERRDEIETLKQDATFRREFLGNISHELKTPIFSVQGYVHTLLDGAMDDKAVRRKFLERAASGADRMAELVQDLNAISRLESGEVELKKEKFNIKELIEEVYESLELQADKAKVRMKYKQGSEKSGKVIADRSQIKQVLTNLVTNAMKYGGKGGVVRCGIYDMDENYLIEVTDEGEGIEEQHLPRVFERFYRVDKSRSRNEGGSGLGLAIVKHIIESHGQSISVRSSVGKGTTFGFTLEKVK